MVHALEEIHRVLIPGGILVDLRPLADRWPVEVACGDEVLVTGRLTDLPAGLADDAAANQAMEHVTQPGWFRREQERFFPAFIYWDDPEEMAAHIRDRWADFTSMEEDVSRSTRVAWLRPGKNKRVRVRARMLISTWRKD
jgi:SAM-dependent methyltransferase